MSECNTNKSQEFEVRQSIGLRYDETNKKIDMGVMSNSIQLALSLKIEEAIELCEGIQMMVEEAQATKIQDERESEG